MQRMNWKRIKNYLTISIPAEYKRDIKISINGSNIFKGKIISLTFMVLELLQTAISILLKGKSILQEPDIFYIGMYLIMFFVMAVFLLIFIKLGRNVVKNNRKITIAGVVFMCFILLWCGAISLLDQINYGQIIVYTVAVISVAVVPVFEPVTLLLSYLGTHVLFLGFMPYFQKSGHILFGNIVNSTTFILLAWVIAFIRYKSLVEDYKNKIEIQKKSKELERINKELAVANEKASQANRVLEKISRTDSLTGIFNRSVFDKTIHIQWDRCRCDSMPISLIMIDIDYFKAFNDTYGHQAGDECLVKIAGVLSACARRSSDIVARYGGEEFAVILPGTEKHNACQVAENIRRGVERLNILHESSAVSDYVTISLGVATIIPSEQCSIKEFISISDKALYKAKNLHRNIVVVDSV